MKFALDYVEQEISKNLIIEAEFTIEDLQLEEQEILFLKKIIEINFKTTLFMTFIYEIFLLFYCFIFLIKLIME